MEMRLSSGALAWGFYKYLQRSNYISEGRSALCAHTPSYGLAWSDTGVIVTGPSKPESVSGQFDASNGR